METRTPNPSQQVFIDVALPEEHQAEVKMLANFLGNISGGRPSDNARTAVAIYRREGIGGVRKR